MQSADFKEDVAKTWFRRPTIFIACVWFLLAAAGRVLVPYVLWPITKLIGLIVPSFAAYEGILAELVYKIGLIALPILWYVRTHKGVEQSMRLKRPYILMLAVVAWFGFVAQIFAGWLSTWWAMLLQQMGAQIGGGVSIIPQSPVELGLYMVIYALLPAFCEELLFRGGLMGAWERRGTRYALVFSSVLFCSLHGSVLGLPAQLLLGFTLGYIAILCDSIYPAMLFHAVYNGKALVSAYSMRAYAASGNANIYAEMQRTNSAVGYNIYIRQTLGGAFLFALTLLVLWGLGKLFRREASKALKRGRQLSEGMDVKEIIVLCAGVVTVLVFYVTDALSVFGVL